MSNTIGQSSQLTWNTSKIVEYANSEEYRFQIYATYTTTDGIYVYYVSDDDTTREDIIVLFDYVGGSQFWNMGTSTAEGKTHFMSYENSMFVIRRKASTKTEIFSLISGEWVSTDIQTTPNSILEYMFDEETGKFYTLTYSEEVYEYNLMTKESTKLITINPDLHVDRIYLGIGLVKLGIIYGIFETINLTSRELFAWSYNINSSTLKLNSIADFDVSIHTSIIYETSNNEMIAIVDRGGGFLLYKINSNLTLLSESNIQSENKSSQRIHMIRANEVNWLFTVSGSERKIYYYQINDDLTLGSRNLLAGAIFTNGISLAVNSAFTPTVVFPKLNDGIVSLHLATLSDFTYSFDFVSFVVNETSIVPYIIGGLIIVTAITIILIKRRKTKDPVDS
ncbi:MAG: hypothetical protein GPJ54_18600 [Candidatus Heimdallarchaeota archaeon]|nr:hypothetical protein [Candidatus Heimdallarchaeota archaeon]